MGITVPLNAAGFVFIILQVLPTCCTLMYSLEGDVLLSCLRREHLSAKDVQKNKAVVGKIEESWEYNQVIKMFSVHINAY